MDECVRADMKLPNLFPFTFTDSKGKSIVVERSNMPLLAIYNELAAGMDDEDRYSLLARVRMLRGFELQEHRMQCLIIRLLSIATLNTLGSLFVKAPSFGRTCHQQRSGLVKGLLTFIKRAIQDVQFQDSVRHRKLINFCMKNYTLFIFVLNIYILVNMSSNFILIKQAASQNFGSGSNTPNVEHIHEIPMSPPENEELSDDDEEAELSMDEMSAIQITMDKMIFETIITQVAAADLVEGFVERDGVEKILSLCNLPTLSAELSQSPFSQSVASIVKFVLVSFDITCFNLSRIIIYNKFSTELRNRIWDAWLTETGKKLHSGFRKYNVICYLVNTYYIGISIYIYIYIGILW
uniref:DUF4806 domain-containing protein n=1 Tax=Heterorhabditis bacteriophora TaxID=37862 RepID=A0A1I7WI31_HETBA